MEILKILPTIEIHSSNFENMQSLQDCLSVLNEVIRAQQPSGTEHEPTPTEYFAVVSTVLSSGSAGDKLPSFLKVLLAVAPSTSSDILKSQFQPVVKTLMGIAKDNHENAGILSSALTCIGKMLLSQDKTEAFWENAIAFQAVNGLLAFIDDENPKIRKATHEAITSLVKLHHQHNLKTFRKYLTDFIIGINNACTRSNYKRAHCVVLLLESIFVYLPPNTLRKIMESCIHLQLCEIPKLTSSVYRTFDTLFQHTSYGLSYETTLSLLQSLLQTPVSTPDIETQGYYLNTITSAVLLFAKLYTNQLDYAIVLVLLQKIFSIFLNGADNEYMQIHIAIMSNIKRIVQHFLSNKVLLQAIYTWYHTIPGIKPIGLKELPNLISEFINSSAGVSLSSTSQQGLTMLGVGLLVEIVVFYERLLALKYQPLWTSLSDNVRYLYDILRAFHTLPQTITTAQGVTVRVSNSVGNSELRAKEDAVIAYFVSPLVIKYVEVYNNVENHVLSLDTSTIQALLDTIGQYLSIVSVGVFLSAVPVISTDHTALKIYDWVLTLFQHELKHCSVVYLSDFVSFFLPLASKLHKLRSGLQGQIVLLHEEQVKSQSITNKKKKSVTILTPEGSQITAKEANLSLQSKLIKNKVLMLWSLFPELCNHTHIYDFTTSYPKLLSIIQSILSSPEPDYPEIKFYLIQGLNGLARYVTKSLLASSHDETTLIQSYYVTSSSDMKGGMAPVPNQIILCTATPVLVPLILQYTEEIAFSDSKFQAILGCLKAYLPYTAEPLIRKITKRLLQFVLLNTTSTMGGKSEGKGMEIEGNSEGNPPSVSIEEQVSVSMAILLAMIPYLSPALLVLFYQTISPLLTLSSENVTLQKRAYHILYTMLSYHLEWFFPTIDLTTLSIDSEMRKGYEIMSRGLVNEQGNALLPSKLALISSLHEKILHTNISSRNMRLKCIYLIVSSMTSQLTSSQLVQYQSNMSEDQPLQSQTTVYEDCYQACTLLLPELMICLKDNNKKTRDQAFQMMHLFSNTFLSTQLFTLLQDVVISRGTSSPTTLAAGVYGICTHLLHQQHLYGHLLRAEQASIVKQKGEKRGRDEESDENDSDMDESDDESDSNSVENEEDFHITLDTLNTNAFPELLHQMIDFLPTIQSFFLLNHSELTKMCLSYLKLFIVMQSNETISMCLDQIVYSIGHKDSIGEKWKAKYLTVVKNILRKVMKKVSYEVLINVITKIGNGMTTTNQINDIPLVEALYKQQRKQFNKKEAARSLKQGTSNAGGKGGSALQRYYEEMLLKEEGDEEEDEEEEGGGEDDHKSAWERQTGYTKGTKWTKHTRNTRYTSQSKGSKYHVNGNNGTGNTNGNDEDDFDEEEEGESDYRLVRNKHNKIKGMKAREQLAQSNLTLDQLLQDTLPTALQSLTTNNTHANSNANANSHSSGRYDYEEEDKEVEEGGGSTQRKKRAKVSDQHVKLSSHLLSSNHNNTNNNTAGAKTGDEDEHYQVLVNTAGKVVIQSKHHTIIPAAATGNGAGSVAGKSTLSKGKVSNDNRMDTMSVGTKKTSLSRIEQKKQSLFKHLRDPGQEYKAKKGTGGDVWKKNVGVQPHAYIPLDPRLLSKKHHDVALEHFGKIVGNKHPKPQKQMVVKRKRLVAKKR